MKRLENIDKENRIWYNLLVIGLDSIFMDCAVALATERNERSQMEANSLEMIERIRVRGRKSWIATLRTFFNSNIFYVLQVVLATVFVAFNMEVEGAVFFVAMLCFMLLVCDDAIPLLLPFLLLCTFTTNCYNSFNTFIKFAPFAPFAVLCVFYHFYVYAKPVRCGKSFVGIAAVAVAITLGGLGRFTLEDYLDGIYYIFGLGLGMMIAYLFMKAEYSPWRRYDLRDRIAVAMSLVGVLCLEMIIIGRLHIYIGCSDSYYLYGISRNNICTMMMFAMPFPLYLSRKRAGWAAFVLLLFAGMTVTASRSGFLMGCVEFVVCCGFWVWLGENRKKRLRICLLVAGGSALVFGPVALKIFLSRMLRADGSLNFGERYTMAFQAIENFLESPIIGTGILDDSIAYGAYNKKGTMPWYHMMIPQIIGSMGLMGVAAYTFQGVGRFRMIFKKVDGWSLCLGISYLGVLLMSQMNPGEFVPLPFEVLTVILFILQERRITDERFPLWERKLGANE